MLPSEDVVKLREKLCLLTIDKSYVDGLYQDM